MDTDTFLPEDFEVPTKSNGYMKFEQGDNKFRIVGQAITGWEYWIDEDGKRKPIRERSDEDVPTDFRQDMKFFMAFPVWNYKRGVTEILHITQKGIMTSLRALNRNKSWGDPRKYDITITRMGEGMETEYTTQPEPHKEFEHKDKINKDIVLEALYEGEDPFNYGKEIDKIQDLKEKSLGKKENDKT